MEKTSHPLIMLLPYELIVRVQSRTKKTETLPNDIQLHIQRNISVSIHKKEANAFLLTVLFHCQDENRLTLTISNGRPPNITQPSPMVKKSYTSIITRKYKSPNKELIDQLTKHCTQAAKLCCNTSRRCRNLVDTNLQVTANCLR